MGQIGVALWLPRIMALPAPMLSLSPTMSFWASLRETGSHWMRTTTRPPRFCLSSRRCTSSSPHLVRLRCPRLARWTRTSQLRCATLSAHAAMVCPLRTLWRWVSPRLPPRKRRLPSLAWRSSWGTSTNAWMVRPSPTLSRRCPSRAWR